MINANLNINGASKAKPYPTAGLSAWYKDRDEFIIPDTLGGDPITILTPTFLPETDLVSSAGDKTRSAERFFDGNSHTLYFKFKVIGTFGGWFWDMGASTSTVSRGINWYCYGTSLRMTISDGAVGSETEILANAPALLKAGGICEMFVEIDYTAKQVRCKIFDENEDQIGSTYTKDISSFTFNTNDNNVAWRYRSNTNTTIWGLKKYSSLKSIDQCRDDSYVSDIAIYVPDFISGIDISGGGNHFSFIEGSKYYSTLNDYLMKYGFTRYEYLVPASNLRDRYVPHDINGNEIFYSRNDWIKRESIDGNLTKYNGADGLLYIPNDEFDRSNTTIYTDLARVTNNLNVGHYDVSNPKRWHPFELNRARLGTWLNTDFNGLIFPHMSNDSVGIRKYFNGIISYSINQTGNNYNTILKYTGDYNKVVNTFKLNNTSEAGSTVLLVLGAPTTSPGVFILWGDGSYTDLSLISAEQAISHTYANAGTYTVEIINTQSVTVFRIADDVRYDNWIFNASQFSSLCPNLLALELSNDIIAKVSGDISGCKKLTNIRITCNNDITFDITPMIDLTYLSTTLTECAAYGSINGLSKMVYFYPGGYCTFSGDPQNMPLLTNFESNAPGLNTITGTLNNLQFLEQICFQGKGHITCNIETLPAISYLSADQSIVFSGSVTDKTALWFISVAGLTGSIDGLVNLRYFSDISYLTMDKPLRLINQQLIVQLFLTNNSYSSEEINQLLADLEANKDVVRNAIDNNVRYISINGTPTGQGITDKTTLQSYQTPPATKVWTVITN